MTDMPAPQESLGVGAILGDSFSIVFGHLAKFAPIAVIPAGAAIVINALMLGPANLNTALVFTDPGAIEGLNAPDPAIQFIATILGMALWGFAAAALTQAVYDARVDGTVRVGPAIQTGLSRLAIVVVLFIVATIVFAVAAIALVVPGLYVLGMWFVIIPAAVIDRSGFGALGRSAELTKGYRWPMVGLVVLFFLVLLVIAMVVGVVHSALAALGSAGLVLMALVTLAVSVFQYCLGAAVAALAYARLREIKEGTTLESLAEVFR